MVLDPEATGCCEVAATGPMGPNGSNGYPGLTVVQLTNSGASGRDAASQSI